MAKPEFSLEQIKTFDSRNFQSVAARMVRSLLRIMRGENDKKYAVDPRGDVEFNNVLREFYNRGFRPINSEVGISRVAFNCVGIIFGNYVTWSEEGFKELGFEIISYEEFMKNPRKYLPEKN